MPRVIEAHGSKQRVPVVSWALDLREETLHQLVHLASQPWLSAPVAAMADAHLSKGVSVGTVFVTDNTLVPEALGGDLGCGVLATALTSTGSQRELPSRPELAKLLQAWTAALPIQGHGPATRDTDTLGTPLQEEPSCKALAHERHRLSLRQLGTLGEGNHFVELDRGQDGTLWLLVHSGSRGFGAAVAQHHLKRAQALCPGGTKLAYLTADSPAGKAFLQDLDAALEFAKANRRQLQRRALALLRTHLGLEALEGSELELTHNHVQWETHGTVAGWVHRKGAMPAARGARLVLPGSMGEGACVLEGLGEPLAYGSSAHGTGRVLTRGEARNTVRPAKLQHALRHVVYDTAKLDSLVEEAPEAYRPLDEVLAQQTDLASPSLRLRPLLVLKG